METGCVVTGRAYDIAAVFDGRESICRFFGLFGACDRVIAFRDGRVARDDGGLCGGLSAFECDLGGASLEEQAVRSRTAAVRMGIVAISFMVWLVGDMSGVKRIETEQGCDISDDFVDQMWGCGADALGVSGTPIKAFDLIS